MDFSPREANPAILCLLRGPPDLAPLEASSGARMTGRAGDGRKIRSVGKVFDILEVGVTVRAGEPRAAVNGGGEYRRIDEHGVAGSVFEAFIAVAGQAIIVSGRPS